MSDEDLTSGNTPEEPDRVPARTSAAASLGIDLGVPGDPKPEPASRAKGIVIAAIVVGLVFLIPLAFFSGAGSKHLDLVQPEGEKAPGFSLDTIRGKHVNLADLEGEPVFLNFWASWCGPCKDEAPVLADAYKRWDGSGIVFLGVDESDSIKWAIAFEDFYGIEYDSAFDPTGEQYRRWGLTGYPETFLINEQGEIISKKIGAYYEPGEIDQDLTKLAPDFTPEPPGKIVTPVEQPPVPEESVPGGEVGGETGPETGGTGQSPAA